MRLPVSAASFLTDFADQAVLLPVAALVGVSLACSGWRRGALVWTLAIGSVLAAMLALKLVFMACGPLMLEGEIRSPSGHTAAGTAIYGGLVAFWARRASGRAWMALPAALAVAMMIGASRLALGVHTAAEVAAGAAVGVGVALAFASAAGRPPPTMWWRRLAMIAASAALLLHGLRLPAEAAIRHSALSHLWPLSACKARWQPSADRGDGGGR